MRLAYPVATPEVREKYFGCIGDLENNLRRLAEIGYERIELFVCNPANFDTTDVLQTIQAFGFSVASVGTTHILKQDGLSLLDKDRTIKEQALSRLKQIIDFAALLNAPVSIGKCRGMVNGQEKKNSMLALNAQIKELCQYAGKRNVIVMIEAQNELNIDNLNSISETLGFINEVNEANLKIHLDTLHISTTEQSPAASLIKVAAKIGYIHCSDNSRLPPGCGNIDLMNLFSVLKVMGYHGDVGMEIAQIPNSFAAARIAYEVMHYILNHIENN